MIDQMGLQSSDYKQWMLVHLLTKGLTLNKVKEAMAKLFGEKEAGV